MSGGGGNRGFSMGPRLELRQSQSLVMTPQLMQAIKLLQLSNLDLAAYVDAELERNPLLDRESTDDEPAVAPGNDADDEAAGGTDGAETVALTTGDPGDLVQASGADMQDVAPAVDADLGEALDETHAYTPSPVGPQAGNGMGEGGDYNLEEFIAGEPGLHDELRRQLAIAGADPLTRLVAERIVENIDDTGYLRAELDELAGQLGVDTDVAERALALVHSCEPVGVGARDLAECLALQLRDRDRHDPAMQALLANLDLLARRDFTALRRACGVDQDDLIDMVAEVRALDPRPGSRFETTPVQPVVPDVFVHARSDGGWTIDLNTDTLPKVLVNRGYYGAIVGSLNGSDDRTWLNDCLQQANWLVKSLDQRARTVLKVASEIVRQQDAFLVSGISHLRPLNLKTVADAIDMHESTVSRVTANKYMATPRGIFELKFFFPTAISATHGGDAHSGEAVRHKIADLIAGEGDDVLSDDQIVKVLRAQGIDIARRTVAKYRESLGLPSSVQRRRERRVVAG